MYSGYLLKRNSPISPPSMQKVYSVLWGTLLFDYENEDDARNSLAPKLVVEILGVSEWDGRGRVNSYPGGFLLVTHTGGTYYVSVASLAERDEWILHLRRGLECVFANTAVTPFRPSKLIQQRPIAANNPLCPKSGNVVTTYSPHCRSCGRNFYSNDFVSESAVLLQLGCEENEKVCVDCKISQLVVLFLKTMNYAQAMELHERTPEVLRDVHKYKWSFRVRRRLSQRLDMAAELFENGNLDANEFEELRQVDHAYRRELAHDECERLCTAIEMMGDDMQTLVNVLQDNAFFASSNSINGGVAASNGLLSPAVGNNSTPGNNATVGVSSNGGNDALRSYWQVLLRVLDICDGAPDLVDFYFPQLVAVFLTQIATFPRSIESLLRLDALQQTMLVLAQKFPSLACKLSWSLSAATADFAEKRLTQWQCAAAVSLLLQVELVLASAVSCLADVPLSQALAKQLRPAAHQKQEIASELTVLFLSRRRLHETAEDEELARLQRNLDLYGKSHAELAKFLNCIVVDERGKDVFDKKRVLTNKQHPRKPFPGATTDISCRDLLSQLGVKPQSSTAERQSEKRETNSSKKLGASSIQVSNCNGGGGNSHGLSPGDADEDTDSSSSSFAAQLDFLDQLNDLVDGLRFVDRPLRTETLRKAMIKWNQSGALDGLGWDPVTVAGEPLYRITRVVVDECRVFRTKARAPSLVVCEVMRDDVHQQMYRHSGSGALSNRQSLAFLQSPSLPSKTRSTSPMPSVSSHDRSRSTSSTPSAVVVTAESSASTNAKNIARVAAHSVVHTTRARAESMSLSEQCAASVISAEAANYDSVSQSIRDVDSLLSESELQRDLRAELHRGDKERERATDDTRYVSPIDPAAAQLSADTILESHLVDADDHTRRDSSGDDVSGIDGATAHVSDVDEESSDHNEDVDDVRESVSIVHLPRWKRQSSFLPASRLSNSTEGILRSGQPQCQSREHSYAQQSKSRSQSNASQEAKHSTNNYHSNSSGHHHSGVKSRSASDLSTSEKSSSPTLSSSVASTSVGVMSKSLSSAALSTLSSNNAASGVIPPAAVLSSAQRLLSQGIIDQREFEQLLKSDRQFRDENEREGERERELQAEKMKETAFGESFASKRERLLADKLALLKVGDRERRRARSRVDSGVLDTVGSNAANEASIMNDDCWPVFDVRAFIVKTNDDLRQEVCVLQLMQICKEIFDHFHLSDLLYLAPYRIVSTGSSSGVVEVLKDAISLDALKHTTGFVSLSHHFALTYGHSKERLARAKRNFMKSLAAYSLFSYLLLIKDRHNGNLLLDSDGHILHIDFGFVLSIAPGGSFSIETAPFKLTDEMVDLLGGLDSPLFGEFVTSFTKGFITLQANCENILSAISVLAQNSSFPCFQNKVTQQVLDKLRARFRSELSVNDAVKHCLDLITNSYGHYGTRQYDTFQYYTNGILP